MSIKLMSEVWACDLGQVDQVVLLVMADHAHDDGTRCFPSVGLIAWKTGFGERSVQYALRRLEGQGVLVRAPAERPGRYQPLEYAIHLEPLARKAPFAPTHARPADANRAPLPEPPETPSVRRAERGQAGAATPARPPMPPETRPVLYAERSRADVPTPARPPEPQETPSVCRAERSPAGAEGHAETARGANDNSSGARLAPLPRPSGVQAETARGANDDSSGARLAPLPRLPGVQAATARGANGDARGANHDARGANHDVRGATAVAPEPSLTINEPSLELSRASARGAALERLERIFCSLAGIPPPERATETQRKAAAKRWWNPLADLWRLCNCDVQAAETLMRRAIGKMRRDQLTLSAPASLYAVALGLYGAEHATTHQQTYPTGAELERRRRAVAEAGTFADAESG